MLISKLSLVLALICLSSPAFANPIVVVPNNLASTVGNTTDGSDPDEVLDLHVQQIYGSGQFLSLGTSILIDGFSFRAAPGGGPVDITIDHVDVHLSTSPYFPNLNGPLLTDTFATNLGPDNTLVYSGPVTLASPGCAENGLIPCPFDMFSTFTTPFLYDPTKGRLLLDLQISGFHSVGYSPVDAVDFSDLPIPYGSIATLVSLADSPTGEFSADGDITAFSYTVAPSAVPEPTSLVLLGSGLIGIVRRRRRSL